MNDYIYILEDESGFYPIGNGLCSDIDMIPVESDSTNLEVLMIIRIIIYDNAETIHELINKLRDFKIYSTDPNDMYIFKGCNLSSLYNKESLSIYLEHKHFEILNKEEFNNKMAYFSSIIRDDKIDGILNI